MTYAGNHGLEILHPDGTRFVHPMPKEYEDKVSELLKSLQDQVNVIIFITKLWLVHIIFYLLGLQKWRMGRKQRYFINIPLP